MVVDKNASNEKGVISLVRDMEDINCGTKKVRWSEKTILCSDEATTVFFQNSLDKVDRQDIQLFLNYFLNIPDHLKITMQFKAGSSAFTRSFSLEGYKETLEIGYGVPFVLHLKQDGIEHLMSADRRVKTLFFPTFVKERELGIHLKKSILPTENSTKIERSVSKRMDFNENIYYEMKYATILEDNREKQKLFDLKFQMAQRPTEAMEETLFSFLAHTPLKDLTEENCLSYILSQASLVEQSRFYFTRPSVEDFLEFQNGILIPHESNLASNESIKQLAFLFRK